MRYERVDFNRTFSNAVGVSDKDMVRDMILFEYSQLIKYNTFEVLEALKDAEIEVPKDAKIEQIVDLIVKNVGKNDHLNKRMFQLIAVRNGLLKKKKPNEQGFSNASGDLWKQIFGAGASAGQAGASTGGDPVTGLIAAGMDLTKSIFNFKTAKTNAKTAQEENKMKLLQYIQGKQGGGKQALTIVLILASLGILGWAVWYATK